MNIWIDILHTPQYNFYKEFVRRLTSDGHMIYITVLNRGKLLSIIKKELAENKNVSIDVIGKHAMSKCSAIFDANVKRLTHLFQWIKNKHIDMAFSNGYLCAVVCRFKGIVNYAFDDDPQTFDYWLKILFSNKSHYCIYQADSLSPKVAVLSVLKEWAYLIPSVFLSDESALRMYGVKPHEYLFVREVSVGTVNYAGQSADSVLQIADLIPKDIPVLLSLEKKDKRDLYPHNWILLQEPLEDIHSLIYYSCGLISSGDSMAREAALLGVPAYYLGIRYGMPANAAASKVANLQNQKTIKIQDWIQKVINQKENKITIQQQVRQEINAKFIDINQYMYDLVTHANKK